MQLTNKRKHMARKPMTFLERIYLPAIVKGMGITLSHLFKKKATIQYPEQKRPMSEVFRGLHILKRDDQGAERCTACGLCALACPAEAITMTAAERKPQDKHLYREEIGPTHPATHGIFQNVLKLDGERIVSGEQTVGCPLCI